MSDLEESKFISLGHAALKYGTWLIGFNHRFIFLIPAPLSFYPVSL